MFRKCFRTLKTYFFKKNRQFFCSMNCKSKTHEQFAGAIMTDADKFINQMMRTLFILSLAIIIGWMLPLITDLSFLFHQYFVLGLFKLFGDSRAGTPLLQQQSALYNSITLFWDSFYSMFIPILASASGAPILFCTRFFTCQIIF